MPRRVGFLVYLRLMRAQYATCDPPHKCSKQPYFISAAYGAVLSIAGLCDEWRDMETSDTVSRRTLIVTEANDLMRRIHVRMPVLLVGWQDQDASLTGKAGVEVLRPTPNDCLRMWPDRLINILASAISPGNERHAVAALLTNSAGVS
jgi:putative SOS response-associated peptidase YedK